MDFDDHDEPEEEVAGLSHYNPSLGNSGTDKPTLTTTTFTGPVLSDPATGSAIRKPSSTFRYRECLKNHAVSIGGHAVDGCGEFLPAGDEGSLDALRCAACSCHRNFHRKEVEGGEPSSVPPPAAGFHSPFSPYYRTPAGYLHQHHQYAAAAAAAAQQQQHRGAAPLALPSTSGGGQGREEMEEGSNPIGFVFGSGSGSGKKRFRTKFTQEQKDKMLAFAEGVGWRIQKQDEAAVQQFCNETMVKRHVLKVWMHNNKHTLGGGKKQT